MLDATSSSRFHSAGAALLLAFVVLLLGWGAVGNADQPISDGDDTDQYEYTGYYFREHVALWPVPHLDLENRDSFYPYGVNQVFLPWGFERDYAYAVAYWLNGEQPPPFLPYYYIYSLLVGALGTYWLLRSRYGGVVAAGAGLAVSVFNLYALYKYPVHLNMAVLHWTTLTLVATFRLLLDLREGRPVSLPYWLLWITLHVQVLGLELGYAAGFALSFTTLAAPVLVYYVWRQHPNWRKWPATFGRWLRQEFTTYKIATLAVGGWLLVSLWLYLPLAAQISYVALQFDFGAVYPGRLWSHPLRLFLPLLPGLEPLASYSDRSWLGDTVESFAQGSPALGLTLLAIWGGWRGRKAVGVWGPVVGLLVLCLAFHPARLPTLHVFPWFAFNRHGGRGSMIYTTLLTLLALGVFAKPLRSGGARWALAGLLLLLAVEWGTMYRGRIYWQPPQLPATFLAYMQTVRQTPGQAVLDWPFCVVGANGVGHAEGLCPEYHRLNAVATFRRWHHKATVGQYLGRLHPDQMQPFLRDGWPERLRPNRPFTDADWQFLDQFLRQNQFAGINLYADALTPQQRSEWLARYGPPVAQTTHKRAGQMWFLQLRKF